MAEFKVRDKETGEIFTVREKATAPTSGYSQKALSSKIIPQLTKGLYESLPFGKRVVSMLPNAQKIEQIQEETPQPKGVLPSLGRAVGEAAPSIAMATPFMGATGAIPKIPALLKTATGLGAFSGAKKLVEGRLKEALPAAAGGFGSGLLLGALGKVGASVIPKQIPGAERIGSSAGGALAGLITAKPGEERKDAAFMAALGAIFPSQRFSGNFGKYAPNKVLAIRQGAKQYHSREVKAYGDMIDDLTKTGKEIIDVEPALDKMQETLKLRGIISPEGKMTTPTNKVDRELLKSWNRLMSKWADTDGKVPLKDVITEMQIIKKSGGNYNEPTQLGRLALDTQAEILSSIKPQIKSDTFQKGNQRYAKFKQNMEAIDKYFDIWGNPKLTGKGERFLMGGLGKTGEAKEIANIVRQETGQGLKGAKVSSSLRRLISNPLARYLLLGGGLGYGLSKARRGEE